MSLIFDPGDPWEGNDALIPFTAHDMQESAAFDLDASPPATMGWNIQAQFFKVQFSSDYDPPLDPLNDAVASALANSSIIDTVPAGLLNSALRVGDGITFNYVVSFTENTGNESPAYPNIPAIIVRWKYPVESGVYNVILNSLNTGGPFHIQLQLVSDDGLQKVMAVDITDQTPVYPGDGYASFTINTGQLFGRGTRFYPQMIYYGGSSFHATSVGTGYVGCYTVKGNPYSAPNYPDGGLPS